MNKKEIVKRALLYFCLFGLAIFCSGMILFDVESVYSDELDFSVIPEIPSSQLKGSPQNYFDLKLQPNEQTTIKLKIVNFSSTEQTYVASIYNAWTNDNGVVEYAELEDSNKIFGKYKTTNVAKLNSNEITIGPSDTGFVSVDVTMPTDRFDGVMAGSISIKKTGLDRNFRRNIALLIRNNEKEMEPSFNIVDGQFIVTSEKKKIKFTLRNESGSYQNLVNVNINLVENGRNYTKTVRDIQMAPYSKMNVEQEVDLGKKTIKDLKISIKVSNQVFKGSANLTEGITVFKLIQQSSQSNNLFLLYYTMFIGCILILAYKFNRNSY